MTSFRHIFSAVALAFSCVAFAQGGFTPLGGFGAGCSFSVETSVSGSVRGDNGWHVSHGSMPVHAGASSSGIGSVETEVPSGKYDIYSLDGRHVGPDLESLDPGIYIISQNGKARKFIKSAR